MQRHKILISQNQISAILNAFDHVNFPLKSKILRLSLYQLISLITISRLPLFSKISEKFTNLVDGYYSENKYFHNPPVFQKNYKKLQNRQALRNKIYDFVIVGSGPGAASAFFELPKNASILIIEKGQIQNINPKYFQTLRHVKNDFANSGKEFIFSKKLPQFSQGSVLGGGSQVNSGLYHDMPKNMADEFKEILRISSKEYDDSQREIRSFLKITSQKCVEKDSIIAVGAKKLKFEFKKIERWRHYLPDGSFNHFGIHELLWNTNSLSKFPFVDLLTNCEVQLLENSQNFVKVKTRDNREIYGRNIILSAGSIGTPYILAHSRIIKWDEILFQWHPMIRLICRTDSHKLGFLDVDPYQAWTPDKLFKFGSGVSTPAFLAIGLGKKLSPLEAKSFRSFYVSFVSTGVGGLIRNTKVPWYRFSQQDKLNIGDGINHLQKIVSLGGAVSHTNLNDARKNLSSVHIFGSMPYKSDLFLSGTNRLKFNQKIMVADGSLLPYGPGVNPQGTIMQISRLLTRKSLSLE